MTLLVPRPDRTVAPHTYAVPVVRELPSTPTGHQLLLLRLVALSHTGRLWVPPPQAAGSV